MLPTSQAIKEKFSVSSKDNRCSLCTLFIHVSFPQDSLEWNRWKELEESRERQVKILQHGLMARETAQKTAAFEAARRTPTAHVLHSEVK